MLLHTLITASLLLTGSTSSSPNRPGTLIPLGASCKYNTGINNEIVTDIGYLVVISPMQALLKQPVFLARGWKSGPDLCDHLSDGLQVRFLHMISPNTWTVLQGIQLQDGRVLVDGFPVDRNLEPN